MSANNLPPGSTLSKLPSYEELQAERDLKQSFASLSRDHEDIQQLFKSVASKLETTPKIGEDNELCKEWDQLAKRHRKLYKDSQLNASQCANFLNNYETVLVPLSFGRMTLAEKRFMINKFLEVIPVHQEAARRTSERFQELAKQVEVFPVKVSSYLRQEADKGGFWYGLWSGVEDLCMSIWKGLHKLFAAIVNTFQAVLSHISTVRFSCGPFVRIDIQLSTVSREGPTAHSTLGRAKRDCKEIVDRLTTFEDAWHQVRLACGNLLENIELANKVSTIPIACDANLRVAEQVYQPLIQCLRAYSTGRSPL